MQQDDTATKTSALDVMQTKNGPSPLGGYLRASLKWAIPVATLVALACILRAQLSYEELARILASSAPEWLLVGLGFYALTNVLRAGRTACLLRWPRARIPSLVPAMFAVSMLNNVLPMRTGELSFPYLLHQLGAGWSHGLAVLLVVRLFDLLAVCLLFAISALPQLSSQSGPVQAVFVAAVGICVGISLLLAFLSMLGQRLLDVISAKLASNSWLAAFWQSKLRPPAEKAVGALESIRSGHVYWAALFYSLSIWLATYAWFMAFLTGIGMPTAFGEVTLGASFAVIAKSLPLSSFGGFGAHEAGWTLGFVLLGQQVDMAIVGGLAVNVLTLVSSLLCGMASLGWLAVHSGSSLLSYRPWRMDGPVLTTADATNPAKKAGPISEAAGSAGGGLSTSLEQGSTSPEPALLPDDERTRDSAEPMPDGVAASHRTRDGIPGTLRAILVLFIVLGTVYSVITPLFETPDEVWHYLYVKYIADGGGLPVYREGVALPMRQEASQPPLFYLLNGLATSWIDTSDADWVIRYNPHAAIGAPAAWGNRNVISHLDSEGFPYHGTSLAAHLVRFLSVLMGAGTVLCTYAIAARLFPRKQWLAVAAAALNAFTPQFLFISASINNDVLTTLCAALCLWLLVCIVQDGPTMGKSLALGIVVGLAALTKLNALVLMPLTAVVLLLAAWRHADWRSVVLWEGVTFAAVAAVAGWWYLRNWMLYRDPFGLKLMFAVLPARTQRPTFPELLHLLDGALKSFWGVFGWFNIAMEGPVYAAFEAGLVLALVGLLARTGLCVIRRHRSELLRLALLALWSVAFIGALAGWSQARYPQGRLLFPAMPAISTLLILGLAQWFPGRFRLWAVGSTLVVLLGFASVVPFRYIAPAYAPAPSLTEAASQEAIQPLAVDFAGQIRLLGYSLSSDTVKPGTKLWVELHWECLAAMDTDYSVFVHLVDNRGVTIAQCDTYPGAGNSPTRGWKVGQRLRDFYPLDIPSALLAEAPLRIRVGLYNLVTQQRLPIDQVPDSEKGFVVLPPDLVLEGQPAGALNELHLVFAEQIALTGYSVQSLVAQPGDTLQMVLRWQALQALDTDYTVFVQLLRSGAEIWGQNDHPPAGGVSPTSTWLAGQVVTDDFELRVSPDAPEDDYQLVVGLYESATVERLGLPNGLNFVVLCKIRVGRLTE